MACRGMTHREISFVLGNDLPQCIARIPTSTDNLPGNTRTVYMSTELLNIIVSGGSAYYASQCPYIGPCGAANFDIHLVDVLRRTVPGVDVHIRFRVNVGYTELPLRH